MMQKYVNWCAILINYVSYLYCPDIRVYGETNGQRVEDNVEEEAMAYWRSMIWNKVRIYTEDVLFFNLLYYLPIEYIYNLPKDETHLDPIQPIGMS